MARLALACLAALVAVVVCHTHSHDDPHAHTHEPAHFKYSRQANEEIYEEEDHYHDHGHAHEHHGHSHEGGECPHAKAQREAAERAAAASKASHSHNDHGHSHEGGECPHAKAQREAAEKAAKASHSHDHGHSHDGGECPHAKAKREAAAAAARLNKRNQEEGGYTGALSFMNDARTRLWVHAIGATLLISIAPFIILFFVPLHSNTEESAPLLKVLLAFGSGGLLGDAFLHLIPHATPAGDGHGHSHSHGHSHGEGHSHGAHDMSVGGWVLAGIIAFLTVEKFVRIMRGEDGHGHSHGPKKTEKKEDKKGDKKKAKDSDDEDSKDVAEHNHDNGGGIKVAAYLNLVADFTHNFTDGLAIGASFLAGSTVGFVTMVTIFFHEIPHEIGDFAILIQSGYTRRKAMMMQLITAAGALSGCVISLLAADGSLADAAGSAWVLPFTAGGFIYIATVSVIPELLENSSFFQSLLEIGALLVGIFSMYLIALYE